MAPPRPTYCTMALDALKNPRTAAREQPIVARELLRGRMARTAARLVPHISQSE
jgi:hypothetical protein